MKIEHKHWSHVKYGVVEDDLHLCYDCKHFTMHSPMDAGSIVKFALCEVGYCLGPLSREFDSETGCSVWRKA